MDGGTGGEKEGGQNKNGGGEGEGSLDVCFRSVFQVTTHVDYWELG